MSVICKPLFMFLLPGQPPAPRYHHSAVVFRDSMFVFGGYTGDIYSNSNLRNKNDLFEYKFTTSQWINWEDKISGPLPPARSAHGAAVFQNKLWIFAGYDGHTRLNDMWAVDLLSDNPQWEQITQSGDSPPTCCNFPVAVVDQSMYVFSGQSGAKITNNLYEFKFEEKQWVRIRTEHLLRGSPCPPQRRYGHTMVAYGRCLYVFGGAADGILDNEVHCFDVDSGMWSVIQPAEGSETPCGRVFHSAAVWDNGLYIFGGTVDSISSRSGDLFCFSFSQLPKCSLIDDFARLLKTEQFCDVHFHLSLSSVPVKAHAAVVAARSPFLSQKIIEIYQNSSSYKAPPTNHPHFVCNEPLEVPLPEVSPEAFKMVLFTMYTDRIHPDLESHSREGMSPPQMLLMMDVYKLALLLETKRLEHLSMQYIEASINVENVLLVLCNASELKLVRLREFCMRFIVRDINYRKVIMSSSFEQLDRSMMVQIIRRQQFRSRPTSPDPHSAVNEGDTSPSSLQDDLEAFLLSDIGRSFTDIVLQIDGQLVPAHIPILAARCSYFEALFRSFMPENRQVEVTFGKTPPTLQSFNSFLKYVYYGDVEMPPEDCLYVFSAPNFFGFTNLRLHCHCKARLEKDIHKENVLQMLEAADNIDMDIMKKHCLRLIAESFPAIVKMPYFRSLKRELLLDIADVIASKME